LLSFVIYVLGSFFWFTFDAYVNPIEDPVSEAAVGVYTVIIIFHVLIGWIIYKKIDSNYV